MMDEVVTYKQLPIEQPEAFKKIINPALFKLLKMKKIGVLFLDVPDAPWAGFCRDERYSKNGEIVMNEYLVEERIKKPLPRHILLVYLHEAAHRLCPDLQHNAVFFAVNLLLFLRAEAHLEDLWQGMSLYDLQDETDLPGSFKFAFELAQEYVDSTLSAEDCVPIFLEKYKAWIDWNAGSDQRQNNVNLKWNRLNSAVVAFKFQRWIFGLAGICIGFLTAAALIWHIQHI